MKSYKMRAAVVACLAAIAGLVTTASLVLSAPANGQLTGDNCRRDPRHRAVVCTTDTTVAETMPVETTTPTTTREPGCENFVQDACAQDGSVISGNGTALHGSVASGCSTAVDKSTASGGTCGPNKKVTPSSPAR